MRINRRLGWNHRKENRSGFTVRDLSASLAILALLLSVQLPLLGGGNAGSRAARCSENLRQLIQAWLMYAGDNRGRITPNHGSVYDQQTWVAGWLDYTSSYDNINPDYLINDSKNGMYGLLGPYLRGIEPFRCPSDTSQVVIFGRRHFRVRSYSMNNYMGGSAWAGQIQYREFVREADISGLPPSQAWVLQHEREDSINDGFFIVEMVDRIVDFPSSDHAGGTYLAFADGHVEHHVWQDPRTNPELIKGNLLALGVPSPDNADLDWLRARTTVLK
jgi:prepilin-type processing-associated H-X9-DG protein